MQQVLHKLSQVRASLGLSLLQAQSPELLQVWCWQTQEELLSLWGYSPEFGLLRGLGTEDEGGKYDPPNPAPVQRKMLHFVRVSFPHAFHS